MLLVVLVGCVAVFAFMIVWLRSDGMARRAISGTIHGANDRNGEISFVAMGPPERPLATTRIERGQYAFDRSNGPCSGLCRVLVSFDQETELKHKPVAVVVPETGPWELDISLNR